MTCFSIQKTLVLALVLLLSVPPLAAAQTPEAPSTQPRTAGATAEKTGAPIVVELYTSSNCSACIFADRILYDTMKDPRVIALSCHIKDAASMSHDGKTDTDETISNEPMDRCVFRHWAFAAGYRRTGVTLPMPTFFFNGKDATHGADQRDFGATIRRQDYATYNKTQEAMMRWKDKDTISIHLPKARAGLEDVNASVWLVRYKDMAVERLDTGINAGRVLRFSNIVQDITHIAKWHGTARVVDIDVPLPQGGKERGGYAVLVAPLLGASYLAAGKLADYPVAADIKEEKERRERAKDAAEGKLIVVPSDKQPINTAPPTR